MEQLICIFGVAVVITLFHLLKIFLMEDKFDFFEILGYYLKASIILNIILIIFVFIVKGYFIWNKELTGGFVFKYILFGSIISLFLPALYYKVRKIKRNKTK